MIKFLISMMITKKTLKNLGDKVLLSFLTFIFPLGRRTATANFSLLRIITPSITACPPIFMFLVKLSGFIKVVKRN